MKIEPHIGKTSDIKLGLIIGYSPLQEDDDMEAHVFITVLFLWWYLALTVEKE